MLLHCFEPRLHASGLLGPLNITDVQNPLTHLDRLRVLQHSRQVGIDDLLEDLVLRSFWGRHSNLDLQQKQARNKNKRILRDTRVRPFGRIYNNFFQTRRSTPHENRVREAHEVATSTPGAARGWAHAWHACRLLTRFPDYFQFFYFFKYFKTEKNSYWKCFGVCFLTNHIPLRFQSLKQVDKYPLGILPELWY